MSPLKILIADDNVDLADGISCVLDFEGYDVDAVYSGKSAVKKLQEGAFDLAFIDIKMPDLSGIEVVKQCQPYVNEKIVLMTGFRLEQILAEVNGVSAAVVMPNSDLSTQKLNEIHEVYAREVIIFVGDASVIVKKLKQYYLSINKTVGEINSRTEVGCKKESDVELICEQLTIIDSILLFDKHKSRWVDDRKVFVVIDLPVEDISDDVLKAYISHWLFVQTNCNG